MIPSCVVNIIREKDPSENDRYTGFKDGVEASEIDFHGLGICDRERIQNPVRLLLRNQ